MGGAPHYASYNRVASDMLSETDQVSLRAQWDSVMASFGRFHEDSLARSTDLLPALAGLAKLFESRLRDTYFAGHWGADLFQSLVWFSCRTYFSLSDLIAELQSPARPVPSWSRLWRRGETWSLWNRHHIYLDWREEYDNIKPKVILAGNSQFGGLRHAEITVKTLVLDSANLKVTKQTDIRPSDHHCAFNWHSDFEGEHLGFYLDKGFVFHLDHAYKTTSLGYSQTGSAIPDIKEFKWVLLGSCKVLGAYGNDFRESEAGSRGVFGLVIYRVPNANTFWRMGGFAPCADGIHGDSLQLFKELGQVETVSIV
jgi:hypothetical protein